MTAYELRISDWSSDVCSSDRGRPFDVVLMDWRLPGMDGIATADRLRELAGPGQAPAIIMLTVHARAEIGRATCRERVCPYVLISVVAVSLKKKLRIHLSLINDNKIYLLTYAQNNIKLD